jgi:hypothetical protein
MSTSPENTNPIDPALLADFTPEDLAHFTQDELAMIVKARQRRRAKSANGNDSPNDSSDHSGSADAPLKALPNPKTSSIPFPPDCLVGSIGDYARVMSEGSEVPPEFFFAAGLTMVGAIASDRLRQALSFGVEPRLYTILLGESYRVKKSTALKHSTEFFTQIASALGLLKSDPALVLAEDYGKKGVPGRIPFYVLSGSPGSAEGLMRCFKRHRSILLALDELKMLVDKASITGSSLLSVVTSLFEGTSWESPIKSEADSSGCTDAHLSMVGCCTLDTYGHIWTREALAIGLTNRLFVVTSDARPKVSYPRRRDPAILAALQSRIGEQLARLPYEFDITPEAYDAWDAWYQSAPSSEHARRLETIGFRLLALIALTTEKTIIDAETVATVTKILDYEYAVRVLTDPIDADTSIAKMEESIRRQLSKRGRMTDRELRQYTNAKRVGLWAYDAAIKNLRNHADIVYDPHTGQYEGRPEPTEPIR